MVGVDLGCLLYGDFVIPTNVNGSIGLYDWNIKVAHSETPLTQRCHPSPYAPIPNRSSYARHMVRTFTESWNRLWWVNANFGFHNLDFS
jgi:hypothetical protein